MNKIIHYIGLDVHKDSISVAIAVAGGDVRHYGKIGGKLADIDKLIKQFQKADVHTELRFCYEAGPTGYGLHRHLTKRKFACIVVAPSLTPRKASDRVKNDRRDAQTLARLYRAGELTSIHIPDPEDEAIRDLVRARFAAVKDQRVARQRLKGLLLRLDFRYTGTSSWTPAHLNYLADLKMPSPAQQLVFEEDKQIITLASERLQRFTTALPLHLADWKWKPVVQALMCLRGVDVIHAMTLIAELGDLSRFDNPTQLMGFLGLTPSEDSTGQRRRQGSITKAGNEAARRALVEAAHQYRQPARLSPTLQQRQHGQPQAVRAIAWKAQLRLCTRFRTLQSHRKISQVIVTAVARELSGFVWAIACAAMGKAPKPQAAVALATASSQSKSEKKPKSKVYVLKPQLKLPKRSAR
jgi:transposase